MPFAMIRTHSRKKTRRLRNISEQVMLPRARTRKGNAQEVISWQPSV
jgi:hypothetical protein